MPSLFLAARLAVAAAMVLLAFAQGSACAKDMEDGPRERGQFFRAVHELMEQEDFKTLETMADRLRSTKARFIEGLWKLSYFYNAVASPRDGQSEPQWTEWFAKLNRWTKQYPASITAPVALASAFDQYAWKARGSGYANTVTEEGWRLFAERLAQAHKVLEQAAGLPERCPEWYLTMLLLARGEQWPAEKHARLFEEAVSKEPTYYDYYFERAFSILPRWGGEPRDWLRLAEDSAKRASPQEGMSVYARIAWASTSWDKEDELFTTGGVRWAKMKQGFEDIERNFPNSIWNLNNFCKFACIAGDRATARALFERIGDRCIPSAWKSREDFDQRKAWALAK